MVRDLSALVPIAVLAIAAVLALATGTRRGVVLPIGNVLVAVLWTFAAMALLGRPLTILSSMLGPELIAIGSVFGIHMVAGFDEEREGPGDAPVIAARTLAHEALPMVIAAATTEIGFGGALPVQRAGDRRVRRLRGVGRRLRDLPRAQRGARRAGDPARPRRDVSALPRRWRAGASASCSS